MAKPTYSTPIPNLFHNSQSVWSLTAFGVALAIGASFLLLTGLLLRARHQPNALNAWMVGKVDVCTLLYSLVGMGTAALWVSC